MIYLATVLEPGQRKGLQGPRKKTKKRGQTKGERESLRMKKGIKRESESNRVRRGKWRGLQAEQEWGREFDF